MPSALWRQTGGIWPMGVSCSLTWYDLGAIAHVIQTRHIKGVLEIGVEHGGLAAYLEAFSYYNSFIYRGIDITLNALAPKVYERFGALVEQRDAWHEATVRSADNWIANVPGPVLIFCDGGDKPKELKLYAPLIRAGDVLLGHDYHNEYTDAALADMPSCVEQVRTDWLDDTLLCMFVRRP